MFGENSFGDQHENLIPFPKHAGNIIVWSLFPALRPGWLPNGQESVRTSVFNVRTQML